MTDRLCPVDRCGAALPPGAVICRGCATKLRLDLREVPALLVELDLALSRQTSMPAVGGLARCEREDCPHDVDEPGCVAGVRLDVDERASDARTALVHVLMGWARVYEEELPPRPEQTLGPICWPVHGLSAWWPRQCRHLSCVAAYLHLRRLDVEEALTTPAGQAGLLAARDLAGRPWAADLAGEVRDAIRRGWVAVDRPPDSSVVGQCPGCGRTLYGPEGADLVTCRACGERCNRVEVREASLAESRKLVTIVQLADALEVPERTARSWVRRGKLTVRRYDMDGRPLYRVSDGQALKGRGEAEEAG